MKNQHRTQNTIQWNKLNVEGIFLFFLFFCSFGLSVFVEICCFVVVVVCLFVVVVDVVCVVVVCFFAVFVFCCWFDCLLGVLNLNIFYSVTSSINAGVLIIHSL